MVNIILFLTFFLFSFGQLGRISFLDQQINGYLYELFLFLFLIVAVLRFRLKPITEGYKRYPWFYWLVLYLLINFFFDFNRYRLVDNLISFLYQGRLIFYFIAFLYLKKINLSPFLKFFIFLTIPFSLVQFFLYPNLHNLLYLGWDPHIYRLFGLFFDTYVAAAIYGMIFFFLLFNKKIFLRPYLLFFYFVFILLTYSRMGLMSFLLTLSIFFIAQKNYKSLFLILGAVFLFIVAVLITDKGAINLDRVFSITARVNDYQKAVAYFQKKPLFGYGYNRIRFIKNEAVGHSGAGFHSSFLIVLVGAGLVGLSLFLRSFWQLVEKKRPELFFLIFLGFFSLADNVLLHPFILFLFFCFLDFFDKDGLY